MASRSATAASCQTWSAFRNCASSTSTQDRGVRACRAEMGANRSVAASNRCAFASSPMREELALTPLEDTERRKLIRVNMDRWRWLARDLGKRSEEHTSELQSLMRISYAVFCL